MKLSFDFESESLTDSLDNLISCLLPHENYDGKFLGDILTGLDTLIKTEEMPCQYEILLNIFNKMRRIKVTYDDYIPVLERNQYDLFLTSGIPDYVDVNRFKVISWVGSKGESVNLDIATDVERARSILYQNCMELYDKCFSLKNSSDNFTALFVGLSMAIKENALMQGIMIQREILSNGYREGRKLYRGVDDALEFSSSYTLEIEHRIREFGQSRTTVILDDEEKFINIRKKNKVLTEVLGKYDIPELDDGIPMIRSRYVVLVAPQNTGKTVYSCDRTSTLLLNGKRVVYMCGETPDNQIINKILPSYINKKFGMYVSEAMCSGIEPCTEEAERLINVASREIWSSGNLVLQQYFTYDNIYKELEDLYKREKFDAVIIDHSFSLRSAPNTKLKDVKSKIDECTVQLRCFKNDYPVFILETSHPSSQAGKELRKYNAVLYDDSPTKGSGDPTKEADDLYIMYTSPELEKQHKVGLQVYKRRSCSKPSTHIYMTLDILTQRFIYNPDEQDVAEGVSKTDAVISQIMDSNTSDDIDEIEEDIFDE